MREEECEPEAVTAVLYPWTGGHMGLSVHLPALRMVLPSVAKTCKGSPPPPRSMQTQWESHIFS